MKRFPFQATISSLCFFAVAMVRAQEPEKHLRPAQAAADKSTPNISFQERLLATIPPGFKAPVMAGLLMDIKEKSRKKDSKDKLKLEDLKVNPRPAAFFPSSAPDLFRVFLGDLVARLSTSDATMTIFGAGTQVASIYSDGQKVFLVSGDQKGREFDAVAFPFQSPDLATMGYVGVEGTGEKERAFLVIGRKTIPLPADQTIRHHQMYNSVELMKWPPYFSPDGRRVAFVLRRRPLENGRESLGVVAGDWNDPASVPIEKGPEFDFVEDPVFSPDGASIAYAARQGTKWLIVTGDKKGPQYDDVGRPHFSPDGQVVAYEAKKGGQWLVVLGDKEGPVFDSVFDLAFSPDSATLAYGAVHAGKALVVVGEKKGPEFDSVGEPVFNPDGSAVAYAAKQGDRLFVMSGDKRGPGFHFVGNPVFSPDGTTLAYAAVENEKGFVVVGEKKGPEFWAIGGDTICFGKDPQTVIYTAQQSKSKRWSLMTGDKRGPEVDEFTTLVISRDRATFAYVARRGNKWFVVAGDKQGPEFDWIAPQLYFSPDGTQLAYGAERSSGSKEREYWWKVLDLR